MDHIKNISTAKEEEYNGPSVESDNESEGSYSDLINEYTTSKVQLMAKKNEEDNQDDDISALTNLPEREESNSNDADDSYLNDNDSSNLKIDSMLFKSQKLLSTIEEALSKEVVVSDLTSKKDDSKVIQINDVYERQLSDKSFNDEFDFQQINLNIEDVVKWAAQLLLALEKLHALGVVCCDLNLNNLLIDGNGDLLLTYMCSVSEEKTYKDNADLYLAPELFGFNNNKICCAADWWSYGTILYELLVGLPLKSVHPEGITSYMTLKIPKYVLPEGRSLLKQLLVYEPSERLGCGANGTEDIKTHPFFNSVSWDYLFSKYI